jgi:hypothetical protein
MPRNLVLQLAAFAASVALCGASAEAGKPQGRPAGKTAVSGSPKTAKGPSSKPVKTASATKARGPKATAKPSTTTTKGHGGGKAAKARRPGAAAAVAAAPTLGRTGMPLPPNSWTPNNPVAQKLSTKTNLLNRVQRSLPPNTDLNAATAGFRNFGQFIAAVNVSNNLGINFSDLKAAMTGTSLAGIPTGQPTRSLGQAIQQLRPGVDATREAQKAQLEANHTTAGQPITQAAPRSATR